MFDLSKQQSLFRWPRLHEAQTLPGQLCAFGAPCDRGNAIAKGAGLAPSAIRLASGNFISPEISGIDYGDVDNDLEDDLSSYLEYLSDVTCELVAQRLVPLLIGGDHSLTYGPVQALGAKQDISLVWFDAHTDFSPWSGQGSHNHKEVLRRICGLKGVRDVLQVGYRGITTEDERNLDAKATVLTSAQACAMDPQALSDLIPNDIACYISIDIDVLDPEWAPGTSAPVPDGLSLAELQNLILVIIKNRRVAGIDLVEVNPRGDVHARTSKMAARLLHSIASHWHYQLPYAATPDRERDI